MAGNSANPGDGLCIVRKIDFSGNRTTREAILRRELEFHEGDTLQREDFSYLVGLVVENLMNTALFNFVVADTTYTKGPLPYADIRFVVTERWYFWPFPVVKMVDRNFNSWLQHSDLDRITYGFYLQKDNFRGKKEKLVATYITGYERVVGFTWEVPYLTRQQHIGLSLNTFYHKNHSVNYDSRNNKPQDLKVTEYFLRTSLISSLRLTFRQGIHLYHNLLVIHSRYDFADTLLKLNPGYSFPGEQHPEYLSLGYRFKADYRDYQPYPLKGFYADLEFIKEGIDLLGATQPNSMTLKGSFRRYVPMSDRFFFASGLTGRTVFQEGQPFFMARGLGYGNDFIRGYEYYVIDGDQYLLCRSDLKYNILKKHVTQIPRLPESVGKVHYTLFLTAFLDLGYVRTSSLRALSYLGDRVLLGTGLGLNALTYYDKVMRLEVSFNDQGEAGLFMHFVAPI